ncbi:MAG: amidase family protein [Acidimicrobiales bacterium]
MRLGIGSDSGGSIRVPAAWCGVVGMKPSAGLIPAHRTLSRRQLPRRRSNRDRPVGIVGRDGLAGGRGHGRARRRR